MALIWKAKSQGSMSLARGDIFLAKGKADRRSLTLLFRTTAACEVRSNHMPAQSGISMRHWL
jgi:hypothetical protein